MVEQFSVGDVARAATHWAASPVGRLVRVEVLVTVSCTLLATLVFLGSGRRTSRSAAFRFVVWLALMLCYPAVSYTIGLIQSGSFRNDLVVVWACFLIGCADGIFACSIDHSDQQSRTVLNQATQVIYVLLLLLSDVGSLKLELKILLFLLWALNVAKLGMRLWSLLSAGRDKVLTKDNWIISNYMAQDYVRSEWDFDPEIMKGYRYVVAGEKDMEKGCAEYKLEVTDDLITVERLWQPESGRLLSNNEKTFSRKFKDLCLSLALFKLLRRRLDENPVLHERDDVRTLVLVRRGLAGGDSSEDHERMFRVIEVELGFLFDFFYARYPSPKQSLIPETAIFVSVLAVSLSTLFCPALLRYHNPPKSGNSRFVATGLDIWLARFVIVLFVILELYQYLSLVLSDWHKVKMLCRYARKPSWHGHAIWEWLLWLMCTATLTTGYWNHSVAQYSLLHACLRNELCCVARTPLLPKLIKDSLMQTRTVTRRDLPVTVKRAIHRLLRSEWLSNLRYGDRALQRNKVLHDFDWATSRYQHGAGGAVGSVLVWHIATTICAAAGGSADDGAIAGSREVATTLSDYCAYLLFQAPELVTDSVYDARLLMEAIQLKMQQFLKHKACRSNEDMFHNLSGFEPGMQLSHQKVDKMSCFKTKKVDKMLPESPSREQEVGCEEYILNDGIKLGHQIIEEMPDEAARWDVLSQVWVELLLSAAPSNINVTAHVKKLATGGELITQLWALLTHGGVVDKPNKPSYTE